MLGAGDDSWSRCSRADTKAGSAGLSSRRKIAGRAAREETGSWTGAGAGLSPEDRKLLETLLGGVWEPWCWLSGGAEGCDRHLAPRVAKCNSEEVSKNAKPTSFGGWGGGRLMSPGAGVLTGLGFMRPFLLTTPRACLLAGAQVDRAGSHTQLASALTCG